MSRGAASYPEAVKFLEALLEGVAGNQYLEIRDFKNGGAGRKKFYGLDGLRQRGFESALPGYLDGKSNIYYGVAPRYEPREAKSDTDRSDAVDLVTAVWFDEITKPAPDIPQFSWMVETSPTRSRVDIS